MIDADYLERQRAWSARTFGPGQRTEGIVDHIASELQEVLDAETAEEELAEWVDVIILAFDGAWRVGFEPAAILEAIAAKQSRNEQRTWPDWRTADPGKAIEHLTDRETPATGR